MWQLAFRVPSFEQKSRKNTFHSEMAITRGPLNTHTHTHKETHTHTHTKTHTHTAPVSFLWVLLPCLIVGLRLWIIRLVKNHLCAEMRISQSFEVCPKHNNNKAHSKKNFSHFLFFSWDFALDYSDISVTSMKTFCIIFIRFKISQYQLDYGCHQFQTHLIIWVILIL